MARVKYGKKSAQEQCTRVHKWITGRPLTDRYTLVLNSIKITKRLTDILQLSICLVTLHHYLITRFSKKDRYSNYF